MKAAIQNEILTNLGAGQQLMSSNALNIECPIALTKWMVGRDPIPYGNQFPKPKEGQY